MYSQSVAVFNRLLLLPCFRQAQSVLFYYSMPSELPTRPFIHSLIGGKDIYLPRVHGDSLQVVRFNGSFTRHPRYNLLEPSGEAIADLSPIRVVIVPGMAFDRKCQRMGHGGGYYDRFLPHISAVKIGICFECQLFPEIPVCEHDVPMDYVVTPSHTLTFTH